MTQDTMSQHPWLCSSAVSEYPTIQPIGVYSLAGLTRLGQRLMAVDVIRGYLVAIDPYNNDTRILNPYHVADLVGVRSVTVWQNSLWFTKGQEVHYFEGLEDFLASQQMPAPQVFTRLPYPISGVALGEVDGETRVYVSCQKSGYIHCFDRHSGEFLRRFPQPGIGTTTLTVFEHHLWVCDREEQTVYCLDPNSGEVLFSALTPFSSPTGIAFYPVPDRPEPLCYLVYADEQPYIRDNPNSPTPFQLTFRDRTFIHPLHIYHHPQGRYTLSNGYLVELSYVEELQALEAIDLHQVEWRIALPTNTLRQRVLHVEPIGHPFRIEEQDGQKVAVFTFDRLQPYQGGSIGWKVVLEMYGLKYYLTAEDIDENLSLPVELQQSYLVDDDELAMDSRTIQQAAREARGTETNVLRKMLKIRNYVYDRLAYGIQPRIDTPDVALARGVGSCGEYVGVLLALARLNGIACRTIGLYKCPPHPELRHVPLEPDFNHVWLEFYVPGIGWLPMESNVDDTIERGPYPQRYFMGLSWFHAEIGKNISFEKMTAPDKPNHISMGDLAINHIRFRILEELIPNSSLIADGVDAL
jgi:transglutaminase-like putative cysteine protease